MRLEEARDKALEQMEVIDRIQAMRRITIKRLFDAGISVICINGLRCYSVTDCKRNKIDPNQTIDRYGIDLQNYGYWIVNICN